MIAIARVVLVEAGVGVEVGVGVEIEMGNENGRLGHHATIRDRHEGNELEGVGNGR